MRTTALIFFSLAALAAQGATLGDNFNDNLKNTSKWGADEIIGHGVLLETNGRLQYSCPSGTGDDDFIRQWILSRMPYNSDWEMQMDVSNNTSNPAGAQNSFGIKIRSPFTDDNEVFAELYASRFGGGSQVNGFHGELETGASTAVVDTGHLGASAGAVRMAFTSSNKVITLFYDLDVSNGYQWVQFGSFGVAGSGGADGNTDWGMTAVDTFPVFVYGFSSGMTVTNGQLAGDNFSVTGSEGRFDDLIAELQARSAALAGSTNKTEIAQKKALDKVLATLTNAAPISLATDLKNAGLTAKGLQKVFAGEFSAPMLTSLTFTNLLGGLLQQIFDGFHGDIAAMEQAAQRALDGMPASSCKDKAQTALNKAAADLAAIGGSDFATVFKAVTKAVTDTLKGQSLVQAAASCKSSGGGGGGGGGDSMKAQINGTAWSADDFTSGIHFTASPARVNFVGSAKDGSQMGLSVYLGTTPIGVHNLGGYFFSTTAAYYIASSGQMTITVLNDSTHKITASFSLVAHNQTNAQDVINITSGTVSLIDLYTQ